MKNKSLLIFVVLSLILALAGCGKEPAEHADEHAGEEAGHDEAAHKDIVLTPEAIKIAGIEIVEVRQASIQEEVKVPGVVTTTAKGRAVVTPPVAGKVVSLLVSVGDKVAQGQAVATLESYDLAQASTAISEAERSRVAADSEVNQAQAELDLARGRLRTAQTTLARQKALAKTGAFSQPSLQAAQRDLSEAQAELDSASREESLHRSQLERAERLFKQELISKTDLERARLDVEQDLIRKTKAQRQIANAQQTLQREEQIAQQGLLNAREVQTAEAEVRASNTEVERSKIGLSGARSAYLGALKGVMNAQANYSALKGSGSSAAGARITLKAPMSGVVVHREATVGQAVERTSELFEIENLQTVWVRAGVPERDIALVRKGAAVQLTTSTYPGRIFTGVVQVIGSGLDPKTRSLPVQCLVQNAGGLLKPQMSAQVHLGIGSDSKALVVPKGAVVGDADEAAVFIAEEGNTFERVVVKLGRSKGDLVEILEGLEVGQRVVSKGAFVLVSEAKKADLKGHEH